MAIGTIVIDLDPDRTDGDICDDLITHDVAIVEIGTRPTKMHRLRAIEEVLSRRPERWGREEHNVLLTTRVVNSKGLLCTYDTIDDLDNWDEFDVLLVVDSDGVPMEGVEAAIERLAVEWRKRGKPRRFHTHFEYEEYPQEDDDEEDE